MDQNPADETRERLQHLKRVSRIKHVILQRYLPTWAIILGSRHQRLAYFDCFAGPGQFELEGRPVAGSPIIAVNSAIEYLRTHPTQSLSMCLIDDDRERVGQLQRSITSALPYPKNLTVNVHCADSKKFIPDLLSKTNKLCPSFFLVDPYGHPLPIPTLNSILRRDRTEALVNLMWFRINMDLSNPLMKVRVDELFGDDDWSRQSFMQMRGVEREIKFVEYFKSRLNCRFVLPFKIGYDPEDIRGGNRTKYYLLHLSNHQSAVLLMKEIMWPLGDEEGTFDYSGQSQGVLISSTPTIQELQDILLRAFMGKEIGFDELRKETWALPFVEKHYRRAILELEGKQLDIRRISSKKTGLRELDRIQFRSSLGKI